MRDAVYCLAYVLGFALWCWAMIEAGEEERRKAQAMLDRYFEEHGTGK